MASATVCGRHRIGHAPLRPLVSGVAYEKPNRERQEAVRAIVAHVVPLT